jgi:hypothetical protein
MAAVGISFYYDEEKVKLIKEAAKEDGRTPSNYIQILLAKKIEADKTPITIKKKKRILRRKRNG